MPINRRAVSRASDQAAAQSQAADQSLAGAAALAAYEAGSPAAGYGPEASHPSVQRLSSPRWAGKTSTMANDQAQAAQGSQRPVWVTVPVDKVVVQPDGRGHVAPVYATTEGYSHAPGESAGSIPPAVVVGR